MRTLALALFFLFPGLVGAAAIPTLGNDLEIQVFPSYPSPGDIVTFRVVNTPGSPETPSFVWRINGQIIDQGVGRNAITTPVGDIGSALSVSVTAVATNYSASGQTVIRPSSVDIVWEADTETLPFVPLLPLPNGESLIHFYAVPNVAQNGARVSQENLKYTWYVNGAQAPTLSGIGEFSFKARPPQFENKFTVSVIVETRDGSVRAQAASTITPTRPYVLVYEDAPLLGLRLDHAVMEDVTLREDEIRLTGFPIAVHDRDSLEYSWSVNGQPTNQTGETERDLTLRRESGGSGVATVNFSFVNSKSLFEKALGSFLIRF